MCSCDSLVIVTKLVGGYSMKICRYCGSKALESDKKCTCCGAEEFYQIVEDENYEKSSNTGNTFQLGKYLKKGVICTHNG